MNFKSKKISLLILGLTAILSSRTMFVFFDDPEGPNLLVTTVAALFMFFLSWAVYRFNPSTSTGLKRLLLTIFIQIAIVTVLYFCLN